ncbi:MAG: hypothetical protein AAFY60_02870 [Myxococcota bacterium]
MTTRILPLTAVLFLFGCDQLTATVQGVAILTQTPRLTEVEGLPTSLTTALGDAVSVAELGTVISLAAISERDSVTDTSAPEPLSGAQVTLESTTAVVGLCELVGTAPGTYQVTTQPSTGCDGTGLEYVENSKYVTAIETNTERYTLTVESAPGPVETVTFAPAFGSGGLGGVPTHPSGMPLSVDWSANGGELDGFVTVFRIDFAGDESMPQDVVTATNWQASANNPVFDNFPRTGGDALDFVLGDPVQSVTVPGAVLTTSGLYLVLVTAVDISTDVSSNLSLGSSALAGAGRAWAFWID